jgi:hypothetical protein
MAEQRIYQNETIYLPDLARTNATVTATFQDCEIRGPAVVVLLGNTVVDGPTFGVADDDIESILFEVQEGFKVGVIGLQDCRIVGGSTNLIGFVGTKEMLDKMRAETRIKKAP